VRWTTLRRWFRNGILAVVLLCLILYLARDLVFFTFLYRGTRADWELSQVPNEFHDAHDHYAEQVRRRGALPEAIEQAKKRLTAREAELRRRCLALASANPATNAELAAYYLVANLWPKTQDAEDSRKKLMALAVTGDMRHWGSMFHTTPVAHDAGLRPLASALVRRVKESPDHEAAARLLTAACNLTAPGSDVSEAPAEFVEIADLITERYATSPDIVNFTEHISGGAAGGSSPPWAQRFEPHLRRILALNEDRFVRCGAKMALASLVEASGESRQPEADTLYREFLAEFDGKLQYHAQGIENMYRKAAERELANIRSHGLGKPAPETQGVDLEGRSMTLSEYRGKVVLVSFWATWCFPCMKLIPHEKRVVEQFDRNRFAIVGVNSDTDLQAAREAASSHGITWRSFRNRGEGAEQISRQWNIVGYPTLYLLDGEGIVRKRWIGNPPPDDLETRIEHLLAQAAGAAAANRSESATKQQQERPAPVQYQKIEVADDSPSARGFIGKIHRSRNGHEAKYCVFVPLGYDGKSPLPTILFLHGAGYIGSDGRKQLTGALANAIKLREAEFPFLTIFPQAQEGGWGAGSADGKLAMAILDVVSREYAIDPARVYLTGLSMGGEGTWSLAGAHPNRWAAIVPICGGGDPGIAPKIKHIPCWCFHGDADQPEISRKMIIALQEAGGLPLYHEYPGVGHNCWDRTYAMPDLYEWLLRQRRAKPSRDDRSAAPPMR
jgi:thiol-disulfide isomerase/thioredoxin